MSIEDVDSNDPFAIMKKERKEQLANGNKYLQSIYIVKSMIPMKL